MSSSRPLVAALLMFAVICGLVPPLPLHAQQAPPPIIGGVIRYKARGLSAILSGGFLTSLFVMTGAGVAMQRMLNVLRLFTGAPGLSDNPSIQEINTFLRSRDNIDLSILPFNAGYDAEVVFRLERTGRNTYELKDGTIRWSGNNKTDVTLTGDGGNTHRFNDRFSTEGSARLDPATASIILKFDTQRRPATFDLQVNVSHPLPIVGKAIWSSPAAVITMTENGTGDIKWNMSTPFFPYPHSETQPGSVTSGGVVYSRHGPAKDVVKGRETWRDPNDTHVLVEYELYDECAAYIEHPREDERLFYDDGSPGRLRSMASAVVFPEFRGDDLKWIFPPIRGSRQRTNPEDGRGWLLDFNYENLPTKNREFGRKHISAQFVELRGKCNDPAAQPVRVFFTRDAENNPRIDGWPVPNWFYYWKQTRAAQGHEPNIKYGERTRQCQPTQGYKARGYFLPVAYPHATENSVRYIYICDFGDLNGPMYFRNPVTGKVTYGIDTFAQTVRHEWAHLTNFKTWWLPERGYREDMDRDGDSVPDDKEAALGLLPNVRHTHFTTFDDEHYLVYKQASEWLNNSVNSEDWACPGKQSGGRCDLP